MWIYMEQLQETSKVPMALHNVESISNEIKCRTGRMSLQLTLKTDRIARQYSMMQIYVFSSNVMNIQCLFLFLSLENQNVLL